MLKHEFQVLNLQTSLADLDIYNDSLIVLEAVGSSDTGRFNIRQPLQPVVVQPTQQIVEPELQSEAIKSPPVSARSRHDENLFYQSSYGRTYLRVPNCCFHVVSHVASRVLRATCSEKHVS